MSNKLNKDVASLIATALGDDSASHLLTSLGIAPSALLSSQSSAKAFIAKLVEATEALPRKDLEKKLAPIMMEKYSFVRFQSDESSTDKKAYRVYVKTDKMLSYVRPNMLQLKREILELGGVWLEDDEQEKILYAILSATPVISEIERRFFAISEDLYWDNKSAALVPAVPKDHRCFIRLFDSRGRHGGGIVYYPVEEFTGSFSRLVQTEYTSLLTALRKLPTPISFQSIVSLPSALRSFHFIEEWADGDPGVYWDILTLISTVFMRDKPLGAYFLIGLTRNGKSSLVNLLHSIFGTANTSRTKLSKLGDPHHSEPLEWSILNAPDDEEDDITQYQGAFKELAGHNTFDATKLYRGSPIQINGANITFVFPMNTLPMWKGTSASACSKRTIPIPFLHSFDSSDAKTNNFEQTTYTRDTLGRIAAQAMALATFFTERPEAFGYSQASSSQKQAIQEDNDSVSTYKKLFHKYFGGFQTWELLYDDYCNWCQQKEYRFMPRSSLVLAFQEYKSERYRSNRIYPTATGKASRKCRRASNNNPDANPLMSDLYIEEFKMDVDALHRSGGSAVYKLEEYYGDV